MHFSKYFFVALVSFAQCLETTDDFVKMKVPVSSTSADSTKGLSTSLFKEADLSSSSTTHSTVELDGLELTAVIDGNQVNREKVLDWEANRIRIVTRKMQNHFATWLFDEFVDLTSMANAANFTDISNIKQAREALADAKIKAGDYAMRKLVYTDTILSTFVSMLAAKFLRSWSVCEIQLTSNRGTAEGYVEWFRSKIQQNDERAMLVACPDHYVFGQAYGTGQDVTETTGGSVLPSHFGIDYNATGNLPILKNSSFTIDINGAAYNDYNVVIGGTNHQFRSLKQGFEVHPKVFFPSLLPNHIIAQHRWHLACEFSNWITAYVNETGDP